MPGPSKSDIQTLDFSSLGSPFANVSASPSLSLENLDFVFIGDPFWAITEEGLRIKSNAPVYTRGKDSTRTSASAYTNIKPLRTRKPCYTKGYLGLRSGNPIGLLLSLTYHHNFEKTRRSVYTAGSGSSQAATSKSVFCTGGFLPITSAPVYVEGNLFTKSNAKAYTKGKADLITSAKAYVPVGTADQTQAPVFVFGNLFWSTYKHAFTRGNLSAKDSTKAFTFGVMGIKTSAPVYVTPFVDNKRAKASAFTQGVLRTGAHCFLNAKYAQSEYIWLKTPDKGETKSKRFLVLQKDYEEAYREKSQSVIRTISGGTSQTIGEVYTTWRMTIRTKVVEKDPSLGTKDDLEFFYTLKKVIFIDHNGYEYKVDIVGNFPKSLVTVQVSGDEALYFYRLNLIKTV